MTRVAFWLSAPLVLIAASVAIARYQRRKNAWLDRVEALNREDAA